MPVSNVRQTLRGLADNSIAEALQRFFKTGTGEYGEGDVFIGIKVPLLRKLAAEFEGEPLQIIRILLKSKIHEERMLALMMLVRRFARQNDQGRRQIYDLYVAHGRYINNWDLVDGSAPYIVGPFLWSRNRKPLYVLAKSSSVWERRIAVLSTFHFIRQNDFAAP